MVKTFLIPALAAALGAGITPAFAHDHADRVDPGAAPTHVAVVYADLNLGSAAGQNALHRRIAHAAAEACMEAGEGLSTPRAVYEQRACRAHAMAIAEGELAGRVRLAAH